MNNVDVYGEFATFESANTVRVGDEVISGETIVINAGGRARFVPFAGIEAVDWLDNRKLFNLTELPQHLVIVGGSYISMEFAQIFFKNAQIFQLRNSSHFRKPRMSNSNRLLKIH